MRRRAGEIIARAARALPSPLPFASSIAAVRKSADCLPWGYEYQPPPAAGLSREIFLARATCVGFAGNDFQSSGADSIHASTSLSRPPQGADAHGSSPWAEGPRTKPAQDENWGSDFPPFLAPRFPQTALHGRGRDRVRVSTRGEREGSETNTSRKLSLSYLIIRVATKEVGMGASRSVNAISCRPAARAVQPAREILLQICCR
jgi:hypothetical protein